MILGFLLVVAGYAVFYWGLHHFPGVDCPDPPNKSPDSCRYSLVDLLAISNIGTGISKGNPLQLNPGGSSNSPQNQSPQQQPPSNQTQPQNPSNKQTPKKTTPPAPKKKPDAGGVTPGAHLPNPAKRIYCTVCCAGRFCILGVCVPCPGCSC